MKENSKFNRQRGMTLMELISSLAIIAAVVVGALALFGSADSSQKSTQLLTEITALRSAVKSLWTGQGSYGVSGTNLNGVLYTAKRVPATMKVDSTSNPVTLTHSMNGTATIISQGTTFQLTVTNIPSDVCVSAITASGSGSTWSGISVNGAAVTLPPSPEDAAAKCASNPTTIVFSSI